MGVGGLITRVAGTTQVPVTQSGQGAVVTGIAGGTVSSLAFAPPSTPPGDSATTLAQTSLVFDRSGQVYRMGTDGTHPTELTTIVSNDLTYPTYSPDGTKIAFSRYDTTLGKLQLYTMTPTGGTLKNVTTGPTSYDLNDPTWSPDGTKIAFTSLIGGYYHNYVIRADGTGYYQTLTSANNTNDFSSAYSPDGTMLAFECYDLAVAHEQIYVANADGTNAHRISDGQTHDHSTTWSPLVKAKKFVGAGGAFGASASGFLVGQQDKTVTSLVVFNAQTPDSAHLDIQGTTLPNQPNLVFTVSGNLLNALSYVNGLTSPPTTVLSASSTATGAVVSFDATRGTVTGVFPYTSNKAQAAGAQGTGQGQALGHSGGAPSVSPLGSDGLLVYRGHFLGAWNGEGKNLAPSGASEVRLNAKTGTIVSVQ